MARIESDPNYTSPTFSRATAATDLFKKEDVQALAAALSTHDHSTGKGVVLGAASIPNGTITSAMIADATIDTADLKDGAVTSAKILDGTIATGDLANSAVTNAKLGTDTARANLLTNGGFEIWQRGNGPFTGNSTYTADRWYISLSAGSTMSVSRDTTNVDAGSLTAAAITYTQSTTSQFVQLIENKDLIGRQLTFSIRVRCSTPNAVQARVWIGSEVLGTTHSGGGAWETLSVTFTAPSISFYPSLNFKASCTAYLDNAMLVVGSVAADYAPLHPADDLARCMRYYEQIGETAGSIGVASYTTAGNAIQQFIPFKVRKAVLPTTTKIGGGWSVVNTAQPTVAQNGLDGFTLGMVATATGPVITQSTAGGIVAEANP